MMINLTSNNKVALSLIGLSLVFAFSCKKEKQEHDDPSTQPVVTSMEYFSYDGKIYTEGPHFTNRFILNDLGVPNSVIAINGHNFSQDFKETTVLFNNTSAAALWSDSTRILVMIPDNVSPGPATLAINTNGKTIIHSTKFMINAPNPQISGLSVESGMVGSKLVIYGSDFSTTRTNNKVTINGLNATVDSAALTAIYVSVPATSGPGEITLTTHGVELSYKNNFNTTSSSFSIIDPGTTGFGLQNLVLDGAGNIYGTIDNMVYKISPNGTTTVLATLSRSADAVPHIGGCAVDASGNVYVSSPYTRVPSRSSIVINGPAKVYKITPTGSLSVFAGKDYPGRVDGKGTNALFYGPKHLSFDPLGNLYVNDQTSIRKIAPDGTVSTFVDKIDAITMGIDAKTGDLYVMQASGNNSLAFSAQIRKITPGGVISTPAINPVQGALPGGLFPDVSQFYQASTHLAVDAAGDLVLAIGTNLYKIKNSVITNTYLNPTYERIIALALDATGKLYLTLPQVAGTQSSGDKFVIYKVTP